MIRTCEAGHPPVRLASGTRCPACARRRETSRPTRQERGYGAAHLAARRALLDLCRERGAVPCAYGCGTLVTVETVVAAHVVDGRPDLGWMASCRSCNERAKHADGGGGRPQDVRAGATPAPWQSGVRPGFSLLRGCRRDCPRSVGVTASGRSVVRRLRDGGGHAQGLDDPGDVPEDIVVGPVSHKWAVSLRPDKPGFAQHSKVVGGRRQADPVEHAAVTAAHLASPAIWRSMSSRTGCASAARSRTSASMGPDLMSSAPMITVAVGEDFLPMAARRPPRGHQASQMKYMPTPIMTTPLPRSMAPVQRPAARRRFTTPVNVPASTTGTPRPSA